VCTKENTVDHFVYLVSRYDVRSSFVRVVLLVRRVPYVVSCACCLVLLVPCSRYLLCRQTTNLYHTTEDLVHAFAAFSVLEAPIERSQVVIADGLMYSHPPAHFSYLTQWP
jgi:hypothetical protein